MTYPRLRHRPTARVWWVRETTVGLLGASMRMLELSDMPEDIVPCVNRLIAEDARYWILQNATGGNFFLCAIVTERGS